MAVDLSGLKPRDSSSTAIRVALAAAAKERAEVEGHRERALEDRRAALRDPGAGTKGIVSIEERGRQAELELERLALITEDLNARLAVVLEQEDTAAKEAAVEAAHAAYAEAVNTVRAQLPDYAAAAAVIARVCAAEKARAAALGRFRSAVRRSLPPNSIAHPHLFDPGIEPGDASFLGDVVLPGLPGEPPIVEPRRAAPTHVLQHA